jgi:hypothetical protein
LRLKELMDFEISSLKYSDSILIFIIFPLVRGIDPRRDH